MGVWGLAPTDSSSAEKPRSLLRGASLHYPRRRIHHGWTRKMAVGLTPGRTSSSGVSCSGVPSNISAALPWSNASWMFRPKPIARQNDAANVMAALSTIACFIPMAQSGERSNSTAAISSTATGRKQPGFSGGQLQNGTPPKRRSGVKAAGVNGVKVDRDQNERRSASRRLARSEPARLQTARRPRCRARGKSV